MPPNEDSDAIPVPGEWQCTSLEDGLIMLETPVEVVELPGPEILDRLKVGERYRLVLIPAYVTVATSDEPSPE